MEPVSSCPICGAASFGALGQRSDGIAVLQCGRCRMGMVAERPIDTSAYYSDAYYSTAEASDSGYSEYPLVAAHSLGWVRELIGLLGAGGKVLDVGCADGHLLRSLGRPGELYGVEVNQRFLEQCRRAGIQMLGTDICDPSLPARYGGSFAVITAIAVLEHVVDIRTALDSVRALLASEGVLIFEVPLISPTADNRVWFTSSLEHVYYPTREGLEFLFETVFGLPLIGRELVIKDYASTFVGLATRSARKHLELGKLLEHLLDTPIAALESPVERSFRLFFDLVHAAAPTPENVALLTELDAVRVTPEVLYRLATLWRLDLARLANHEMPASAEASLQEDAELGAPRRQAEAALVRERARNAELRRQLTERDARLREVEARLAARQRRRASLEARLVARERRVIELEDRVGALERHTAGLEARVAERDRSIKALLTSTSWRLTTPVRWVARVLKALLRRLRPSSASPSPVPAPVPAPVELPVAVLLPEPWPESRPLVSVVVPCFEYGRFVAEAVDSVLAQTFQDLEVLVIDGGSRDAGSLEALRALRRAKTRVWFRQGRHLVGDNRNYGIARARGKYVCCLDADDLLRPTYLEKAVFLLEGQGYDVISTSIESFGEDTRVYRVERYPTLADMVQGNHVPTCAVFRKELWERAGGFQDAGIGAEHIYEDWRLWVRFAALGARIANIVEEPLFRYRVHSQNSLSRDARVPPIERQREAILAFNRDVIDEEAFHRSEERRRQRVRLVDPLHNLRPRHPPDDDSPTILLAMPFLILGGAESLLGAVAGALRSRGYRLVVVTTLAVDPAFGDTTPWFEAATAEIYHLPRFLEAERWRDFVSYLFETREVSLLWIVGSAFFYDLLPELKAERPDLRVIDLLFNTAGHTSNNRRHSALIDLTLVENLEVYEWLRRAGESEARLGLIPSGVDLERYRPAARPAGALAELGIAPEAFVVGFSGRLSEEKSPEDFLRLAELCRDEPGLAFLMTGAGPLEAAVRRRIDELGMGARLQFLGQVEDVRRILGLYDVLVLPSVLDGRPVVVLESLAMGVPVVASHVGALPDLVREGETGFLCAPGDAAAFAERVRWLAAHPDNHRRMRAAARAFAEAELDAGRMFDRYEEAIRRVLALTRSAAAGPDVPLALPPGAAEPIVLVLPFFTIGGAERVLETLLAAWRAAGRTVVVLTTEPLQSGMSDRLADLQAYTPFCYALGEMLPRERWLDAVVELLLALPQPTLLSVGCAWFYEAAEELRARVPGLRLVDQLFNAACHLDLNRQIASSLDVTIAAYTGLAEELLADGRPCEQVATVHVGIERPRTPSPQEVEALRRRLEVPRGGKLVAFVGRLAEEKRPEWLVRLAREAPDPQLRFLVVGDGPRAAVLEEAVREETRLRWVRRADAVETVLAAADAVVLPSRFEGIPLVLMEALAAGRPVVATRVGGIPELAGTRGLELVEADDFGGFRDAVLRVLEHPPLGVELPPELQADAMVRRYDDLLFGGRSEAPPELSPGAARPTTPVSVSR